MVIVTLMPCLTKDLRPFVDIDKTEGFINRGSRDPCMDYFYSPRYWPWAL